MYGPGRRLPWWSHGAVACHEMQQERLWSTYPGRLHFCLIHTHDLNVDSYSRHGTQIPNFISRLVNVFAWGESGRDAGSLRTVKAGDA